MTNSKIKFGQNSIKEEEKNNGPPAGQRSVIQLNLQLYGASKGGGSRRGYGLALAKLPAL